VCFSPISYELSAKVRQQFVGLLERQTEIDKKVDELRQDIID